MKNKVCAVVLTYNRKGDLIRCMEGLKNQCFNCFDLLIVDNSSSDGTLELLKQFFKVHSISDDLSQFDIEEGYEGMVNENQSVTILKKFYNDGSAGGFASGLSFLKKTNYEWFWVMDDDGLPHEDCLKVLMDYSHGGVAHCISPNLLTFDHIQHFENVFSETTLDHVQFDGGLWNGVLLNSEIVKAIGVPYKSFFIWGEETEYLDRMSEFGFVRITVKKAIHYHKSTKFDYGRAQRVFYLVRNKIFMIRLHKGIYVSKVVFGIGHCVVILRLLSNSILRLNFKGVLEIVKGIYKGLTQSIKDN